MIELSFVWWHAVLIALGVIIAAVSIWFGVHAGWKMAFLWPLVLLFGSGPQ